MVMFLDLARRLWRVGALITTGVIVGAFIVAPTTAAPTPAATQTRALSCPGIGFHVIDADTEPAYEGTILYRRGTLGSGFFVCPVDLPHRAVVTKVQFTLKDAYVGAQARFCGLVRIDLAAGSAGAHRVLGEVPDTGSAAAPGTIRRTDNSISYATVDNTRYSYYLQCQLTADGSPLEDVDLGLYGATVIYRISSSNG
jgi:hypothetical protein